MNGYVCHLDDVNDFSDGSAEVVHSGGEDESGSADASRSAARRHPVAIHPLYNVSGFVCHPHRQLAEFQLFCEAIDEIFWVDGVDEEMASPQPEFLKQSFVCLTKLEDIELYE